jgi:ADP-heptose:LPS heptosyltransferase
MLVQLRRWQPDALVYLHEPRGTAVALRDAAFFRACGIRRMAGVPWAQELSRPRLDAASGLYEHKTALLTRRLAALGDCAPSDPASWDLRLSAAETGRASALLAPLAGGGGILAMSIGAKIDVKDWGDTNWNALLARIGPPLRGWSLVALGVQGEHARSEALLAAWPGPRLNLCGLTSPRESAAVLQQSDLYLGHDSGPMHLAATVGTPCVAIFAAHEPPGVWFPHGAGHRVLYHKTECYGCALSECVVHAKKCILSIGVEEAAAAVLAAAVKRS